MEHKWSTRYLTFPIYIAGIIRSGDRPFVGPPSVAVLGRLWLGTNTVRSQVYQKKEPTMPEQITADIQSAIERLERELDELKLAEKNKKTKIRKHMKALAILNGGQDNQATETKE